MADRRTCRVIATIAAAVIALVALLAGWSLHDARQSAIQRAETRADLMARAFGAHAQATVGWLEASMRDLDRAWTPDGAALALRAKQVSEQLGELVFQITAVGPDGAVLWSSLDGKPASRIDLSDREHIRVHLAGERPGLFVSAPVLGRVSKRWSIQFTHAIRRDGALRGILVFSVAPEHFARFYRSLPISARDVISMVRSDGTVLVRAPDAPSGEVRRITGSPYLAADAPAEGTYRNVSPIDRIPRFFAYRRIPDTPMTVVVGLSEEEALAATNADAGWILAGAFAVSVAVLLLAWMAMRAMRNREARARELGESNLRLESSVKERTRELQGAVTALEISRSAMDSAAEGIVIVDALSPDLPMVYVNEAFERLTGYARQDVLGKNCRFLQGEDRDQAALATLRSAIREGRPARVELRNFRKDGTPFLNALSIAPLRDPAGKVTHFVGIQNDITERVRLELLLRESQKMDAIGQLTGGLAHDFNNLLGVVVGNLDLIGEQLPPGKDLANRHRAALDAALRGAEVTRALLAVARRQPLRADRHDLNARIEELMPLVRSSAGAAITVELVPAAAPLLARLDATGLSNAVLNLVINARDALAASEGDRRLVLRTRAVSIAAGADPQLPAGRYALLEVEDNGPGMAPEVARRAFEPFFTTKEAGRGTGLGLSMVRGFAEQLGGTVRIESSPGIGTTVRVYLPLEDAAP